MLQATIEGGVVLGYETTGTGEPVALIHGALIADIFGTLLEQPSLRGYALIAYHRRGYVGSTRSPRPLSIAEQAADCRNLLRYLGIARAHILGHSFGGAVALQLAIDFPETVQSLALLEPALMLGETGGAYRESLEEGIQRYRELDTSRLVDGFMEARWPGYRSRLDEALPGAFDQAVADAGATFEADLPGLLTWDFSEGDAARVTQPVLSVLGGESEQLWPRFGEVHRWLLARLPNVEGYVLPNAHHFLQVENPHDLAEALAAFLKRYPLVT